MPHLSGHGSVLQVVRNVHRGHQQAPLPHLSLDEHAEFAADVPRVDRLYGRLVVTGQFHQVHHLCSVQQFPPVEVRPIVGREVVLEERMLLVDIGSGSMGRPHLEPRGVPEHGQVGLLDVAAQRHLPASSKQDGAATFQDGQRLLRQLGELLRFVGSMSLVGFIGIVLRIHPEVPMILP